MGIRNKLNVVRILKYTLKKTDAANLANKFSNVDINVLSNVANVTIKFSMDNVINNMKLVFIVITNLLQFVESTSLASKCVK